jgi:N-acyl-D-aspartate/D-glutamate deacylase
VQGFHDLAVESGVPMTFGMGAGPRASTTMDMIDAATAAGGRMFGQTHSRGIQVVLTFLARTPFDNLPGWKPVRALAPAEQLRVFADPAARAALVHEAEHGDYGRAIGAEAPPPDFSVMRVHDDPSGPNPTVADLAAQRGTGPVDLVLDLAVQSDLAQLFTQPLFPTSDDALLEVMRYPHSVMTFSDSGAHVSQIADASIQTYLLAYWVRAKQAFTFEEAVRMLTSVPADAWGFAERGLVREGHVADLNVIDPERVAPALPTVEHDLPAGARRLVQRAVGFRATIVAGEIVLADGEPTGRLPGRLLRNPLPS